MKPDTPELVRGEFKPIAATMYKAMGLDPETTFVRDALRRPFALSAGTAIKGLFRGVS